MTSFVATVEVAAPVADVWQRLVDWPAHSRWIPLTTVTTLTARPDGVGARFVGRSAVGRFGFDDPMEVTEWLPPGAGRPGRCALRKLGRVITGTAAFDVAAVSHDRTLVVWQEDIGVAPTWLTRWFGGVIAAAGRRAFAASIRAMGRELLAERAAAAAAG